MTTVELTPAELLLVQMLVEDGINTSYSQGYDTHNSVLLRTLLPLHVKVGKFPRKK